MAIAANLELVARCGLYCGACNAYLKGRCPGCARNEKATWCKIRACCQTNAFSSCAECTAHASANECGTFNNFVSRIFALLFRSNRNACIEQIKRLGLEGHARKMAELGLQTIRSR